MNATTVKKEFITALTTEVSNVYFQNHINDNTFIRCELARTIDNCVDRRFSPLWYCKEPEYSPQSGLAVVFYDEIGGGEVWCHVPKSLFKGWLRQAEIDVDTHPVFRKK